MGADKPAHKVSYAPPLEFKEYWLNGIRHPACAFPARMALLNAQNAGLLMSPAELLALLQPEAVVQKLLDFRAILTHENFSELTSEEFQDLLLKLEQTIGQYRNICP
jgi:hypothetical protein